jgi:Uma2 family endonuclease
MIAQLSPPYTPADYLEFEVNAETRHEYINGGIIPMTGGTPNHNRIIRNLCTAMTIGLRGQAYEVFVADQRLWIPEAQIYTYPDVMVVQGELVYQPGRRDTLMNPNTIIEVLSQSTRNYDRGDKFAAYRTLPSFQEYLLVDQYTYHVERYRKTTATRWMFEEYDGLEATVVLETLEFTIALPDLYDKVQFEAIAPDTLEDA